jgi:thymidine kinase
MELELLVGPMFAGKTTSLISRITRLTISDRKCIIIRSSKDTRTKDLKTHGDITYNRSVLTLDSLMDIPERYFKEYDVFGIDETHFFSPDDVESFINKMDEMNKTVIVTVLKSTHERKPFKGYDFLYALSTNITSLNAVCKICKGSASNIKRRKGIDDDNPVGGEEKYYPCCNKCWHLEKNL